MDSILEDIKGVCGIEADDTSFDRDVIMVLNSEFSVLNQQGIGPAQGFMIEDNVPVWDDLLEGEMRLNMVKTYLHMKTRLIFDPPATSFGIAAMQNQAAEYLWRIREFREEQTWVPTSSTPSSSTDS